MVYRCRLTKQAQRIYLCMNRETPKKKNDKKQVSDFLKDSPADKSERISGSEIFRAASMKNETTRRVLGFLLLAFSFYVQKMK